ncbi:hypothetical protein CRG98_037667 [Punica granatum]|uniref:Retrovirus-related Pol polyprotein from transposon TNT 1-94 n=1 Tax=Punica granatum TaxID=22663 RepID=A0A2I0ID55_PUNGR|nr:hypothetical protein CRG98_037667 [Punica granatum]
MADIPYSSTVSSLMYSMVCTQPDIAHAVGVVSKYLSNPRKIHWKAMKWILRYPKGTSRLCLCFGNGKPILGGFTDADIAVDHDSKKSTSGYLFILARGAVTWQSKLHKCVALFMTEAKYIAANETEKEILWMKRFLQELGLKQDESFPKRSWSYARSRSGWTPSKELGEGSPPCGARGGRLLAVGSPYARAPLA